MVPGLNHRLVVEPFPKPQTLNCKPRPYPVPPTLNRPRRLPMELRVLSAIGFIYIGLGGFLGLGFRVSSLLHGATSMQTLFCVQGFGGVRVPGSV